MKISGRQGGKNLPLRMHYDKAIWSGLSWAVAEAPQGSVTASAPIEMFCSTDEERKPRLLVSVYAVAY